jgi:hypothetical protein
MANITLKDLVNHHLHEEVASASFVRDLSEEQLNLRGGIDRTSDGEPILPHCDVIINLAKFGIKLR